MKIDNDPAIDGWSIRDSESDEERKSKPLPNRSQPASNPITIRCDRMHKRIHSKTNCSMPPIISPTLIKLAYKDKILGAINKSHVMQHKQSKPNHIPLIEKIVTPIIDAQFVPKKHKKEKEFINSAYIDKITMKKTKYLKISAAKRIYQNNPSLQFGSFYHKNNNENIYVCAHEPGNTRYIESEIKFLPLFKQHSSGNSPTANTKSYSEMQPFVEKPYIEKPLIPKPLTIVAASPKTKIAPSVQSSKLNVIDIDSKIELNTTTKQYNKSFDCLSAPNRDKSVLFNHHALALSQNIKEKILKLKETTANTEDTTMPKISTNGFKEFVFPPFHKAKSKSKSHKVINGDKQYNLEQSKKLENCSSDSLIDSKYHRNDWKGESNVFSSLHILSSYYEVCDEFTTAIIVKYFILSLPEGMAQKECIIHAQLNSTPTYMNEIWNTIKHECACYGTAKAWLNNLMTKKTEQQRNTIYSAIVKDNKASISLNEFMELLLIIKYRVPSPKVLVRFILHIFGCYNKEVITKSDWVKKLKLFIGEGIYGSSIMASIYVAVEELFCGRSNGHMVILDSLVFKKELIRNSKLRERLYDVIVR